MSQEDNQDIPSSQERHTFADGSVGETSEGSHRISIDPSSPTNISRSNSRFPTSPTSPVPKIRRRKTSYSNDEENNDDSDSYDSEDSRRRKRKNLRRILSHRHT